MADHPKRADHFLAWAKLMAQQAIVPERPSFKKSGKGTGKRSSPMRRKRFRKRKRNKEG